MQTFDIVICTTAVSRMDLHAQVIPKYVSFLKDLKCLWIVNIDQVLDENVLDTVENFKKLVCDRENIQLDITYNTTGGTRLQFYNSVKDLVTRSKQYTPNYGYLWLEDDWGCSSNKTLKEILVEIDNFSTSDYLQLVKRPDKILSFNPGLFGNDLYKRTIGTCIYDTNSKYYEINPEAAAISDTYNNYINLIITANKCIYYPCFHDVGRTWQAKQGMSNTTRTFGTIIIKK